MSLQTDGTPKEEVESAREFERECLCFKENSEHLRSLNSQLWQVPLLAMTLTGGLWYGIAQQQLAADFRNPLLCFVGFANVGLIFVMLRVRAIFDAILKVTQAFYAKGVANTNAGWLPGWSVVAIFCTLMGVSALFSFIVAANPDRFFKGPVQLKEAPAAQDPKKQLKKQKGT